MKISLNWLSDFIELPESPEAVAAMLTGTGLETEHIEPYESVKGGLKGVVIGTVLTCARHPNADKLSVTTVSAGGGEPLHIVCGAPNVAAGQRVAVAPAGTTLYTFGGETITLKATKIRGEASEGMICAEDELGLGPGHDGIMILETNQPDGTPLADHLQLYSDTVLEIGLTPNRADAASHLGVARDLRALLNRPLRMPEVSSLPTAGNGPSITVDVQDTEGCIRYSGLTITGVKVQESPAWLKNRLLAIGIHPISNVVDITNYVLHELGQPLHAFDAAKIRGKKVIVRTVADGTSFRTLDNKDRQLTARDLMICDAQGGMCIAGVFGGIESGITTETTTIFLESACFSPAYIRKTSQHHQLVTDASFRFARGTDPNLTITALRRAAALICELTGGAVSADITDIYPAPVPDRTFIVRDERINALIGANLSRDITWPILNHLDIATKATDDGSYYVTVPPYRVDVTQEADIAEEILRIYGFNAIPLENRSDTAYLADFPARDPGKFRRALSDMLTGNGFSEMLTNSLINEHYQERYNVTIPQGQPVTILNKLSEDQGMMRQTLLFSGLEVLAYNINRKEDNLRLFEFGKIYWTSLDRVYGEKEKIGLFLTGQIHPDSWQDTSRPAGYHDLAQTVRIILQRCNMEKYSQQVSDNPALEYGASLMRGKQLIGDLGLVKTSLAKDFGIRQPVFFAEIDVQTLFQSANPSFGMRELPRFPKVRRDLSLVLDRNVSFGQIRDLVHSLEKNLIRDVTVFDVYEGKNIPAGKKAYALAFTLQDSGKTLTDADIDQVIGKLMDGFEKNLGAVIRK